MVCVAGPLSNDDVEKGSKCQTNSNLAEILPVYRQDSHLSVQGGSHDFPGEGTYLLKFDNSYSLWRNKTLYYRVYYSAWDASSVAHECINYWILLLRTMNYFLWFQTWNKQRYIIYEINAGTSILYLLVRLNGLQCIMCVSVPFEYNQRSLVFVMCHIPSVLFGQVPIINRILSLPVTFLW